MKTGSVTAALFAFLVCGGLALQAEDDFRLETNVYVFKNVELNPAMAARSVSMGTIQRSPATLQFARETLSLFGSQFEWSGGRNPPDQFSLISSPAVPLPPGQPVTLLSQTAIQYLEKLPDGSLRIREIAAESPDAPHCKLTFTLRPGKDAREILPVAFDLDVASVIGRETLAGVTLQVGKPTLARFSEKLRADVRPEEWSALLVQSPNGSDYSLLLLFRVSSARAAAAAAPTPGRGFLRPAELDKFATYYYLQPKPDSVADAISAMGPSGFTTDRAAVFTGFFAEVFAANPERVPEWKKVIARQDKATRFLLQEALRQSRPGRILDTRDHSIEQNDMYWGAFFASGNIAYVRKLAEEIKQIDSIWLDRFWVGATAKWSLARNAPEHPLVRTTLEGFRTEVVGVMREHIDEVLHQDAPYIRQEIAALRKTKYFRNYSYNPFGSDYGDFSPGNSNTGIGAGAGQPPPGAPSPSFSGTSSIPTIGGK